MNKQAFIELAEKISTGVATEQEIAQFNQWYESFQQEEVEWVTEELGDQEMIGAKLLHRINRVITTKNKSQASILYFLRNIAAAVIVLILSAGVLYWYFSNNVKNGVESNLTIQEDVQPGGDKAMLTLSDGSRIVLDKATIGLLANEGHTRIQKSMDGLITYQAQEDEGGTTGSTIDHVSFNTISTPKGGQYRVLLPDGSEVWLNALSSIRFPTSFTGTSREVTITGEVYFEVKNYPEHPFLVSTEDQVIRVLGTHFNVNAYDDEVSIRTTLVEGSVSVETDKHKIQIIPGQQVINNRNNHMEVEEADIEQVIAWKNGIFQFWNTDLQEIMRQLSRWYSVDVTYLNDTQDKSFSGFISRDVTISNVLRMLEEAGNVQFGLNNNTVSVKTGKK